MKAVAVLTALLLSGAATATTLDEAIAAALAHAPEIAAADAGADASKGRLLTARSGYLPSVSVSGTLGTGRLDPEGFFGLGAADVNPRGLQATVEQPLFAGGRTLAMVDRAKAGVEAAEAGGVATRSAIVLATVEAYGGVLAAAATASQYRQLVEAMGEAARQAEERFRAGEAPSTEVAQAKARQAEAEAGLARAEGAAVAVAARYLHLTGMQPADLQPLPANPPLPETLDEALRIAADQSPELRQAEAGLRAATSAARAARGNWLPEVSAFAEASTVRDQFFPDYRSKGTTLGVRGRWTLQAAHLGRTNEANAEVRAAEARLRAAKMAIEEAVLAAFADIRTAELVERASAAQAEAARQALSNVRDEVEVGMKPQLALLDAAREATGAGAGAAVAQTGRILAAYRLNALLGR